MGGRGPTAALLMDVGGVLVTEYWPGAAAEWGARLGLSPDAFMAALYDGNDAEVLVGRVSEDDWWRGTVRGRLGVDPEAIEALRADLAARERWDPALVSRVRALRGTGTATAVVSNTWSGLRARMAAAGVLDVADELVLSCEVGCAKPDRRIYEIALSRLGVAPEAALFVDDVPVNVDAARALGMAGHVHRGDRGVEGVRETLARIDAFVASSER